MKKVLIIGGSFIAAAAIAVVLFLVFGRRTPDTVILPYISHQKPRIDPHLPSSIPIADKLDEVLFDGLFNVSADASGITYEDGLGEFMGIDEKGVVTVRLKPTRQWHSSYAAALQKKKIIITEKNAVSFIAKDLLFTLERIKSLGSLSPDYILVSQAIEGLTFAGPDQNEQIQFKFKTDRIWNESDIKEVLSFKVLPHTSDVRSSQYNDGTGPYLLVGEHEDVVYFSKNPSGSANVGKVLLKPFIDNSTFTTELKNRNINVLLDIPFGSVSPILADSTDYFYKSGISTTFLALFCNTKRLTKGQRWSLRKLVDKYNVVYRFYKARTPQQRHIVDYKGNVDNYEYYLNFSIFPSTSYYVEEKVVMPLKDYSAYEGEPLPDTVRIQTCLNYGHREELAEMVEILNDPTLFGGKMKVTAVSNEELRKGDYDAVLMPVSGYRSNFLFDLYDIFLREPDLSIHKINLATVIGPAGEPVLDESVVRPEGNFFRIDLSDDSDPELAQKRKLLEHVYGFMSTNEIGDKQMYAQMIDELDQDMALGVWLFSLPSLAYFRTQFDQNSISLYGVSSQLATIEHWKERPKK